ncbi:MAG: hypothetical protein GY714_09980 [Desulfobacterales bacterium]|nr:hypothetical protein [Desulfobacterales bacterium]MCP4161692.1 hypothetical protein [Deltaproteobacteria bacterium]
MSTIDRCPGNDQQKSFTIINVTCHACGEINEVYSDELQKKQTCDKCSVELKVEG